MTLVALDISVVFLDMTVLALDMTAVSLDMTAVKDVVLKLDRLVSMLCCGFMGCTYIVVVVS